MNLLLDTHVFLWWDRADKALNAEARALIADAANQVFIGAASVAGQFERHPRTQASDSRIAWPEPPDSTHAGRSRAVRPRPKSAIRSPWGGLTVKNLLRICTGPRRASIRAGKIRIWSQ